MSSDREERDTADTRGPSASEAFTEEQWANLLASSAEIAAANEDEAQRYEERARETGMTEDEQLFWLGNTYLEKAARSRRWARSVRESIQQLQEQRDAA